MEQANESNIVEAGKHSERSSYSNHDTSAEKEKNGIVDSEAEGRTTTLERGPEGPSNTSSHLVGLKLYLLVFALDARYFLMLPNPTQSRSRHASPTLWKLNWTKPMVLHQSPKISIPQKTWDGTAAPIFLKTAPCNHCQVKFISIIH
jgi:hypothetical protein